MSSISSSELNELIERGAAPTVVDVRTRGEFEAGHVPGAVNIPLGEIRTRTADTARLAGSSVVVYCGHGPRAWMAAAVLRRRGVSSITYLRGHWAAWKRAGLPVE